MAALLLVTACEDPEIEPNMASSDSVARGRTAAQALGCGACHALPGIAWPRGRTGPSLEAFGNQAMIAGRLPNRPDTLARFVRDAPSLVPGTAMPAIAMTDAQAADLAAYLQANHAP
ncbi:c-type cytochrome [Sphingomonas sp. G-3-2-10]|jgi:cytochrome c1|uniref:c-type cytochrome n=1 Tax=Sphingomonas sp. G-3-2-10 TaxID=2728838 RepID=UPI00146C82D7|nr:c-type cytochrome [Sphingomonas sp. G-3-2-10]NML08002.1 c-type cytochrome [Sphingomonas sp. G-3-2-10]